LFHNKLYGKRVYCKSETNWFMRTFFEAPVELYMEPHPIDSYYRAELNGLDLGMIEGYSDGVLFNLVTQDNNMAIEAHRFLANNGEYTLSIRDKTSQALLIDYHGASCIESHKKYISDHEDPPTEWNDYYRIVVFDWDHKTLNNRGRSRIRNPVLELRETRTELSDLRQEQADQNIRDIRKMTKEIKERHEAITLEKPEESAPLPPTRNITICK
ncbi:MAG: hypothetical protein QG670_515, partial [Thermoproteota archaeon]|nr:hypothetical protein [Thermoproteota archaeon]